MGAAVALLCPSRAAGEIGLETGLEFTASTYEDSFSTPPDTMMAVGPDHIVELINGRYAVYDKTSGVTLESSTLELFWAASGANPLGAFDPRILFDPQVGRWYALSVDNAGGFNGFLFAVSFSEDPLDGWAGFRIPSDPDGLRWADFPLLGMNGDAVVVSANMIRFVGGGAPDRVTVLVLPKADLLAPAPSIANATLLPNLPEGTLGLTAQPVVDLEFSSEPAVLLSDLSIGGILVRGDLVGDATSPTLVAPTVIPIDPYPFPPPAPQLGSFIELETVGDQLGSPFQSNLVKVGGSIWGVHTVGVDGRATLRWFELDATTNTVLQNGLIADDELSYYYGSIAVNPSGDVVIGFSGSSEFQYVGTHAVAGRTVDGETLFGEPVLLQPGLAPYLLGERWGDYSATVVDPEDPDTFWTIQEYALDSFAWATRVSELRVVPEPTAALRCAAVGLALGLMRARGAGTLPAKQK